MTRAAVRGLLGNLDASSDEQDIYALGRGAMGPHFDSHVTLYDGAGRLIGSRCRRG